MTTLTLVRHGQASFGARNYDQLSELGARQSRALGDFWSAQQPPLGTVYSGTLSRQQDTARHALDAKGVPANIEIHPAFNEYDFEAILKTYIPMVALDHPELGIQNGKLHSHPRLFQTAFEKAIGYWIEQRAHAQKPFETWQDFTARVVDGLRAVATPDREHVTVFTSGGVIAVALREALGLNDDMTFRMNWRIHNGSVHRFRVGRSGLTLMGFNNITHLELKNDPALITFR